MLELSDRSGDEPSNRFEQTGGDARLAQRIARIGEVGDGKIFVTNLEECIRIRTEERGGIAI